MSIHRHLIALAGWVIASSLAISAVAATPATDSPSKKPLTAQQQRMSDCSKQSSGMSKDQRSTFMSRCLKGENTAAPKTTPQQNMSRCSGEAKAKSLKGDAYKSYLSSCLKGTGAA